ncbi:hypothetical protein Syun_021881 [Stephania yunnanensis]|uniref:Uncharacterized protein n=1 Tax=Stephania yunnanensis TaxID=152371 RepID=A0AAP0IGF2_9MAGN
MDTVSESSMAASASEASPSSTTTTPRSTSTPLSAPPSPAATPSHPTPSSNLPRISSISAPLVSGEDGEVVDVFDAKDVERIRGFRAGAAVVGGDGDFMVGAAMGTRFVLAFESELDEIMNKVVEMSGKCAKEVKVVISPYGICPLGAHIDHQITDFSISVGLENSVAMLLGSRFMACREEGKEMEVMVVDVVGGWGWERGVRRGERRRGSPATSTIVGAGRTDADNPRAGGFEEDSQQSMLHGRLM